MRSADNDDDQQTENTLDAVNETDAPYEIRTDDSIRTRNFVNANGLDAIAQNIAQNGQRGLENLQKALLVNVPKIDLYSFSTWLPAQELIQQQIKAQSDLIRNFYRSLFDHNSELQESLNNIENIVGSFSHVNEARNTWARFGWIFSRFPDQIIDMVPQSYIEANSIALPYARESLKVLREELIKAASNDIYTNKMFEEFEKREYLLTAMLAFTLIEGNIRRWLLSYGLPGGGNGNLKGKKLDENTRYTIFGRFAALANAQSYFFRYADNFNPEREGECNRHFLMHGMASQEISEEICLKLFLILDETQKVLPRCEALIED
jgi:hypothetical protein